MDRALLALILPLLMLGAMPCAALSAAQLAIVYNQRDADSRELAERYARRRGIPAERVAAVALDPEAAAISAATFSAMREDLDTRLPDSIEAYALVWSKPYRVDCMSITSAFAFGYDKKYCASGCAPTATSPYYGSTSQAPYRDHGIRPAMLLSAGSFNDTVTLIDRGVTADTGVYSPGAAYLVTTRDAARSTRTPRYRLAQQLFHKRLPVHLLDSEGITGVEDIMFYFIGRKRVPNLDRIGFRPGAAADHLTSSGGRLDGSAQMSALEWLAAGATGSYGTVVEPCNFPQKFPDPPVMMGHYLNGDTLIEAYWKSVMWPGQGVFVGEPLARPFGGSAEPR